MNLIKKILTVILKKIDHVISVLFGMSGAILLMQFPQFLVQYIQRYGGFIDGAKTFAAKNPQNIEKLKIIQQKLSEIENANFWLKLPVFIKNINWELAKKTYEKFIPGLTLNKDTLLYILTGVILGLLFYSMIKLIIKLIAKLIKKLISKKKNKKIQNNINLDDDLGNYPTINYQ